jgi:DNA-binding PadR family transcriptional regulator
MTGYQLRKKLWEERKIKVSFGTLYPLLQRMQKNLFVVRYGNESLDRTKTRKSRIYYRITQDGFEALRECLQSFSKMSQEIGLT